MVGLGTVFIAVMVLAALLLWRGKALRLQCNAVGTHAMRARCPYIANTAGWMTAELGRQPWLIYGLMRTAHGVSPKVGVGNAWFYPDRIHGLVCGARRPCGSFLVYPRN